MTRTIPRPLLAALVLPLVVIVGFQSAWAAYACRVDGKVRDTCCCKHDKKERKKPADDAPPRMAAQGCCDVTINVAKEAPVIREVDGANFMHVPIVLPAIAHTIIAPRIERMATVATMARPPPRVPLFLDKQAILR